MNLISLNPINIKSIFTIISDECSTILLGLSSQLHSIIVIPKFTCLLVQINIQKLQLLHNQRKFCFHLRVQYPSVPAAGDELPQIVAITVMVVVCIQVFQFSNVGIFYSAILNSKIDSVVCLFVCTYILHILQHKKMLIAQRTAKLFLSSALAKQCQSTLQKFFCVWVSCLL